MVNNSNDFVEQLKNNRAAGYVGKGFDGFFAQLEEAKKKRDAAQQSAGQQ